MGEKIKIQIDNYVAQLEQEKITADVDLKLQNSLERAVMEKGVNIVIGFRFVTEYEVKTTGLRERNYHKMRKCC
jgi:hypothetical protein